MALVLNYSMHQSILGIKKAMKSYGWKYSKKIKKLFSFVRKKI